MDLVCILAVVDRRLDLLVWFTACVVPGTVIRLRGTFHSGPSSLGLNTCRISFISSYVTSAFRGRSQRVEPVEDRRRRRFRRGAPRSSWQSQGSSSASYSSISPSDPWLLPWSTSRGSPMDGLRLVPAGDWSGRSVLNSSRWQEKLRGSWDWPSWHSGLTWPLCTETSPVRWASANARRNWDSSSGSGLREPWRSLFRRSPVVIAGIVGGWRLRMWKNDQRQ